MDAKEFQNVGQRSWICWRNISIASRAGPFFRMRIRSSSMGSSKNLCRPNLEPFEEVLRELQEKLLPYCTHVGHPGYMGLITPSPNPVGDNWRFHLFGAQSESWCLLDRSFSGCDGETDRALAYGYCRLRHAGWGQSDKRRHDGELHRAEAGARLGFWRSRSA